MRHIQIVFDDTTITAQLEDNAAAHDFYALLPLTLNLDDYASTEKIADLPKKLTTTGSPDGHEPSPGDITYYAPWGNLAIFYRGFSYSRGLVKLGHIIEGQSNLKFNGSKTVEILPAEAP